MENNRFIEFNKDVPVVSRVNPIVSYAPLGKHTYNFNGRNKESAKLVPVKLYDIMRQCASGDWKDLEKGSKSMHVYNSNYKGVKPYTFDGVIFIDLDKFNCYPELDGLQHVIFNRFEELCKVMPNLLCIKYSPSGNLHFCVYHNNIKDSNDFVKNAKLYLCCLCRAVRVVIGVDLREYDGVIDTHLCNPDWQLNVNDSPVKWNLACCGVKLDKKQLSYINAEYGEYLKYTYKNVDVATSTITGNGETVVNDEFYIAGLNGYDARTAIAAAAYFHFNKDRDAAESWIANTFKYTDEWRRQYKNMLDRGTIAGKYNRGIEQRLFDFNNNDYTIIPDGQYMSDVIDFNQLTGKPLYLNGGTGIGKTETAKDIAKRLNAKIIILQMNKALRDGKQQGIEDITRGNAKWEDTVPLDRIHTTMEGFNRNCTELDLSEYIVVIDEAHLLQDYCTIDGKYNNIIMMLGLIKDAKQIIFMSATPKAEQNLYQFEMMRFLRFKDQILNVNFHPLKYIGKGSKEATRYTEMLNTVQSIEGKHLIFSNKHQECWKKYGLKDIDYTWFHSKNIEDPKMQSILKNNKLLTDITLATLYLGVGVEIKNETDIHIWFDLNEGWDKAFIEQSIGRPRDAKNIHLHFFYTYDSEMKAGVLSDDEINTIKNAFSNLVIDIEGTPTVNLIAAKMTGIFDANFDTYDDADKKRIEMLKIGQIINSKDYFTVYDVDMLRRLPYKDFKIKVHDKLILNTDGKERVDRTEEQLKLHLCSRTDSWWNNCSKTHNYDDILKELDIYWNDKNNANKMFEDCRNVWNGAVNLELANEYFGSMQLARAVLKDVNNYCDVKSGHKTMKDFEGGEETKENIEKSFKRVETAFNKDWLDYRIHRRTIGKKPRPEIIEVTCDEMLNDILGIESVVIGGEDIDIPYPFRNSNWKETLKELKPATNKDNSKKGGAKKQTIILINQITKETLQFVSKSECMKHFGVDKMSFSRWLKGESIKKMSGWKYFSVEK